MLVNGRTAHPVSARALQARILDDLKAAGLRATRREAKPTSARPRTNTAAGNSLMFAIFFFDELGNAWTRSQDTFGRKRWCSFR